MSVHVVYVADPIDHSRFDQRDYLNDTPPPPGIELAWASEFMRAHAILARREPMDLAL